MIKALKGSNDKLRWLHGVDVVVEDGGFHAPVGFGKALVDVAQNTFHLHHGGFGFEFEHNLTNVEILHTSHHGRFGSEHPVAEHLA